MKYFMQSSLFKTIIIILFLFVLSTASVAQPVEADGSILLPAQKELTLPENFAVQQRLTVSKRWQSFVQKNGQWSVQWNEATGTPHRAFGKGIPIDGYSFISRGNVEAAARTFLTNNAQTLGVSPDHLKLARADFVNHRWYVSFQQMKEEIPVLFSEIELRIFENGNVMALGVDFYPQIDISLTPVISYSAAKTIAVNFLNFDAAKDRVSGNGQLFILPRRIDQTIEYHLVYQVDVLTKNPVGNYIVMVDAHSGEIIWRHNRVRNIDVTVSGEVQEVLPSDPFVENAMADQYVTIGNQQLTTDSAGVVSRTLILDTPYSVKLEGPWVNVNRQDGPDAEISGTLNPGLDLALKWDDSNSHPAERDAFFHVNIVHNFIITLDTNFTGVNYSMPCAININDNCNAFWDGVGINFFIEGGGCPNTGQMPSVVYHEYGHGINDRHYIQAGSPFGMINGATHEGMADVTAAMIEDVPNVGRGFFGTGSTLRHLDNTNRFPDDVVGEVHADGLIIGGAFWDLRVATSLETVRFLHHFARYGTPDDPNTGIAFSEWFVEVLVADDDDGDLSNGTPNFAAINDAFSAHGIGTNLFLQLSFSHTPFGDTQDTENPYPISFQMAGAGLPGSDPDSLFLHYSADNFQTVIDVAAVPLSGNVYEADIPAQPTGSEVKYFITAHDPLSNSVLRFPANGSYDFLVGFNQVFVDHIEDESGWTIGAGDDNATTGLWERADPQATDVGSQPENDNTPNGQFCFVTDGRNSQQGAGAFDVDGGKTTLFSPIYNLTGLQDPVLRYFKWYSNNRGATPGTDFWVVDISSDGGQTWVNVENTNVSTDGWEKFQFAVTDFITLTDSVQLRFIASDFAPGSLVEALIDDVELLSLNVVGIAGETPDNVLPTTFALKQNYPNPFNPTTTITFDIPTNALVNIRVFNLLGQEVRALLSETKAAGSYSLIWDGKDAAGSGVASGIYIYKMEAIAFSGTGRQRFVQSRKLMLLK